MWNKKNLYKKRREKERYTIGDITDFYDMGADSLRYYEKKGLVCPKRGENQYRYYDSWDMIKLNIIKSLRAIDIPVEEIGKFMDNRTVDSTLELLEDIETMMEDRIEKLKAYKDKLRLQIDDITAANSFLCDVVVVGYVEPRPVFLREESYITPIEYDFLRREITRNNDLPFIVIGDNRVGSAVSLERVAEGDYTTYDCIFALDPNGTFVIPGGIYLTIRYRGEINNEKYIKILQEYALRNNYRIVGPYLEWAYLDIHTTDMLDETVTECQVLVDVLGYAEENKKGE